MKSIKRGIILFVLCAIVICIGLYIFTRNLIPSNSQTNINPLDEKINNKKEYSIVYISGKNHANCTIEEYFIVDTEQKVVQETKVITGYNMDELISSFNALKDGVGGSVYNAKIQDKSLVYSTVVYNGENINEVIDSFKNSTYTNLLIREL